MTFYPVTKPTPLEEVNILNGQGAAASLITRKAQGAYATPVCIASQMFSTANAPSLQARSAWTDAGHVTTNVRPTTLKLRADLPVLLEDATCYGEVGDIRAYADIVLYNSTSSSCIVTGLHVYQGDPTSETKWVLTSSLDYIIPPLKTAEIRLYGTIHPMYCHGVKITNANTCVVFMDSTAQKTGTAPKVLHFALYMQPILGWSDASGIIADKIISFDEINPDGLQPHVDALLVANSELHCQNCGTMAPINQYTGNGVYGFELNMYHASYTYHAFMPNTTYNATTETRGSFWIPLAGLGSECIDGTTRYKIRLSWMQRCSATHTLMYSGLFFLPDTTTSVSAGNLSNLAATANTDYVVVRDLYLTTNGGTLPHDMDGVAFALRVQRNGNNSTNTYLYTSQFTAKVIPFT